MPLIQWDQRLRVEVRQCDDQHRRLMELMNDLYDSLCNGRGRGVVGSFRSTVALLKKHCSDEEKLMQTYGYPEFHEQQAAHRLMVIEVNNLLNQCKTGGLLAVSGQNFLKRLECHILGDDKKYGVFLNSKGVY